MKPGFVCYPLPEDRAPRVRVFDRTRDAKPAIAQLTDRDSCVVRGSRLDDPSLADRAKLDLLGETIAGPWVEKAALLVELASHADDPSLFPAEKLWDLAPIESERHDNLEPAAEREAEMHVPRPATLTDGVCGKRPCLRVHAPILEEDSLQRNMD